MFLTFAFVCVSVYVSMTGSVFMRVRARAWVLRRMHGSGIVSVGSERECIREHT